MEKMKIPFGTISITDRAKELVVEALNDKRVSCGRLVHQFEKDFSDLLGINHSVAVATGTDADALALACLHDFGAKPLDEVIIPALSFVATGNSVLHARFTPVFVDIERDTLNIDPQKIEKAITERTRAIMPVHLMGKPAAMDEIMAIAEKNDLYVIEDAAEAHGMLYKGKPAGTIGDMGAFSLYVAHIISTVEGGIIATNRSDFAEVLISLRAHGRACSCVTCTLSSTQNYCSKRFNPNTGEDTRFTFPRVGYSCKMNELEAAVGIGNMELYDEIVRIRHDNLKYVMDKFNRFAPLLSTLKEETYEFIGPHAIPIVINEEATFSRSQLTAFLEKNNIETRNLFQSMPTQCPGFAYLGHELGEYPVAEYMGRMGIHIGCHHDLTTAHMQYFLDTLERFLELYQN